MKILDRCFFCVVHRIILARFVTELFLSINDAHITAAGQQAYIGN
jgi:hypothetical protein